MGSAWPGSRETLCMGVTEEGYKKVLGFTQATTEHHEPNKQLLRDLLERGLTFEEGILCVIDGSKGFAWPCCRCSSFHRRGRSGPAWP